MKPAKYQYNRLFSFYIMIKEAGQTPLKILIITLTTVILFITGCQNNENECIKYYKVSKEKIKLPAIDFNPEKYICYKAGQITIDGNLDEQSWEAAPWTNDFVDIEGELKPLPLHRTRVKMLWDDNYLYIAGELTEPHIWARLRQRDTVIFYDNDFEVFIDPDGDTHEYMEFEMNAYNTLWDLLLTRPYRDNGRVADAWNINGIKTAVNIHGTINKPSDIDNKWVVELAFPMSVLSEFGIHPLDGTQWRINFSRVNWRTEIENGNYRKAKDPVTAEKYPEYNWVWSPQGLVNMHYPEMWGYLQFSDIKAGEGIAEFTLHLDEQIKWNLRTLYYAQRNYAAENGSYTSDIDKLYDYGYEENENVPCILLKPFGYEAYVLSQASQTLWTIDDYGKISGRKAE
ncbi:MAG: carbohydrate-binding family 9-like protein [Bacteroidota bacterium]|nr:carbohydrate-binding family 9-like protein [Bacteroidota bacterium]